jgi:dipeptidyl aminopeptidase/acylaminoacyl peptidase
MGFCRVRPRDIKCLAVSVLTLATILSLPTDGLAQKKHRFTVRDSIEMQVFTEDSDSSTNPIVYSPDGNYFFIVSTRGLLASNEVESTIWLFDTHKIKSYLATPSSSRSLAPKPLVRIACSSNQSPISRAKWSADGQRVEFLGRDHASDRQAFVVGVHTGQVERLSPKSQDISDFDRSRNVTVFKAQTPINESDIYQSSGSELPDIHIGTGKSLFDLLYPNFVGGAFGVSRRQLWQARGVSSPAVVRDADRNPVTLLVPRDVESLLSVSPSGRYLVATDTVKGVPPEWQAYKPAVEGGPGESLRFVADQANGDSKERREIQYVLVDLQTGKSSILVDAPFGFDLAYYDDPQAVWCPDERYVALVNTFMPFSKSEGHKLRPCIAVVEISTREIDCVQESAGRNPNTYLTTPEVAKVKWGREGRELRVDYTSIDGSAEESRLFRSINGEWSRVEETPHPLSKESRVTGLTAELRQSVNERPMIVASDGTTGKSATIWDPNPQLADIELGEASVYHWHDSAGQGWSGGLVKPPDYKPSRKYPMVIQTHGFNPGQFLVDGYAPTANAARALAARGIVVLQIGEHGTAAQGTPREPDEDGLAGYESAIKQLAAEGLVDSERVGIIGFSHTGWTVSHSLINAPQDFRAATMAEADDYSFYEYLINADYGSPKRAQAYADGMGALPFGKGLEKWTANSPGFNIDKIHAPILFEQNSPAALVYSWDLYAALRLLKKPVELLYMRGGAHVLVKPLERLASQEMNVDWYDFWLNGHADPEPKKRDQYIRWHKLRELLAADTTQTRTSE